MEYKYTPDTPRQLCINDIKRFIVCAANRYTTNQGEVVVIGVRHYYPIMRKFIYAVQFEQGEKLLMQSGDQGFIDQWGNWISREDALFIAESNGQYINYESNGSTTKLFSEGLYSIEEV